MSFEAKFPGVCAACDEEFKAGTEVTYDLDGDLVHAVPCPARIPSRPTEVCPHCFLELPTVGRCPCRE